MTTKLTLATLALIPAGVLSLHAQPSAIRELQSDQITRQLQPSVLGGITNAPELYLGENLDVGPQHILRPRPSHNYFDVLFDSQAYYSDNANYALDPSKIDTWVFVNTVQAAITPPSVDLGSGKASMSIGAASQWYNYDNYDSHPNMDFVAQTLFLSGKYTWGKWQLAGGLNLTRLVSQANDYAETYSEIQPNLSLQRVIPINERMIITLGDLVDFHLTDVPGVSVGGISFSTRPDLNNRFDNIASVTFTWQPTHHLLVQPYYRFQYSYYEYDSFGNYNRSDYLESMGITVAYYFTPKISLRAFFNYNRNRSDNVVPSDYKEFNTGPGAALNFTF